MRFELTILGSGSALPTSNRNTTAQVLNVLERFFLIDCGEGTQHQLRKYGVGFNHINHILISHLHGDHFFGLFGLISTMALVGREKALHIYCPKELENILNTVLYTQYAKASFPILFHFFQPDKPTLIFEDKVVTLTAFPLRHSISAWGFMFSEKRRLRNIIASKIEQYDISIPEINLIKAGHDLQRGNQIIPNEELTNDPLAPRSYVFMTDTLFSRQNIQLVRNADVLYHEATYLHTDKALARKTMHTTALQAGVMAREASVKQLLIGHFSSRYKSAELFEKEARVEFDNSCAAEDGDKLKWPDKQRKSFVLRRGNEEICLYSGKT